MIYGAARFRVPAEHTERALAAIRTFVEHVRTEPGTERYVALRDRDDPSRFIHWMVFRDEAAEGEHSGSDAVRAFTAELYPLCDGPVEFDRYELIADT